jgi:hypothetical protein
MKKPTIAGMFLWDVEIKYDGWTSMIGKTLIIATRQNSLTEAQKKATGHLKAFRYDYPKSKIVGITHRGFIDA